MLLSDAIRTGAPGLGDATGLLFTVTDAEGEPTLCGACALGHAALAIGLRERVDEILASCLAAIEADPDDCLSDDLLSERVSEWVSDELNRHFEPLDGLPIRALPVRKRPYPTQNLAGQITYWFDDLKWGRARVADLLAEHGF